MEIIAIIDKQKLPEDIRLIIEKKLSKDLQDELFKMLQTDKNKINDDNISDNKLFAIQTGTVVGNIYTDKKDI